MIRLVKKKVRIHRGGGEKRKLSKHYSVAQKRAKTWISGNPIEGWKNVG